MRCPDLLSSTARTRRALVGALVVVALVAASCSDDGTADAADDDTSSGSPSIPAGFEDAVQAVVDGLVDRGPTPGAAMIVRVPGQEDVIVTSGVDQMGTDVPMSADSRFRVGSVAKTFTGAIIQQLVEEGELSLGDSLDEWYPEFPNAADITIDMLLTHTAGVALLPDEPQILMADLTHEFTIDEVVGILAANEPQFEPGTRTTPPIACQTPRQRQLPTLTLTILPGQSAGRRRPGAYRSGRALGKQDLGARGAELPGSKAVPQIG